MNKQFVDEIVSVVTLQIRFQCPWCPRTFSKASYRDEHAPTCRYNPANASEYLVEYTAEDLTV
jgi:hypothetical protein